MTSYDEIWEFFLLNCKTSDINLPTEESLIYKSIRSAVLRFNNRLRDKKLKCNDETETVDRVMNEDELLILVHYLRLIFLINEQTFFQTTWQPFAKDVGVTNYGTQINSLTKSIEKQTADIDRLIMNAEVDYL